jgi:putative transposase
MSNDIVVYENLQVKNLVKNRHLAKSIHAASWSQFINWTDYYGKVWDKAVVSLPPQYTTQPEFGIRNLSNKGRNRQAKRL